MQVLLSSVTELSLGVKSVARPLLEALEAVDDSVVVPRSLEDLVEVVLEAVREFSVVKADLLLVVVARKESVKVVAHKESVLAVARKESVLALEHRKVRSLRHMDWPVAQYPVPEELQWDLVLAGYQVRVHND